jgi:hypothetical protein
MKYMSDAAAEPFPSTCNYWPLATSLFLGNSTVSSRRTRGRSANGRQWHVVGRLLPQPSFYFRDASLVRLENDQVDRSPTQGTQFFLTPG